MPDVLLVHHTVRGTRGLLTLPETAPRNECDICYSASLRVSFFKARSRVQSPVPQKSRKIWIESSLFCRRLGLYEPWEGEPSGLGQCVTMALPSDPYQGEWDHTNEKKTFGDPSYVLFTRAPKTFKNVVVALTCLIRTSPR